MHGRKYTANGVYGMADCLKESYLVDVFFTLTFTLTLTLTSTLVIIFSAWDEFFYFDDEPETADTDIFPTRFSSIALTLIIPTKRIDLSESLTIQIKDFKCFTMVICF